MSTRQEKYPETATFHFHNQNPKGRITGDCVYRAISYATGVSYRNVVMDIAEYQCESGYSKDDKRTIEYILNKYGWRKCRQPKHSNGKKYTLAEFVKEYKQGTYVVQLAHHVTVVEDGKNVDIWDCVKYGGCVGNYFVEG